MTDSRYLSVTDSYNLLQSSQFSLDRRRSASDLKKVSPQTQRRLLSIYSDNKQLSKSSEIVNSESKNDSKKERKEREKGKLKEEDEEEEEDDYEEDDEVAHEEDERIFMEYQRTAMLGRRRKSFNDVASIQSAISSSGWNRLRGKFKDKKIKDRQSDSSESTFDDTPSATSIESLSPPPPTSPPPRICIGFVDDDNILPNTGWSRLKRIFKENKLKEESMDHLSKPTGMNYNTARRGSCDSQLAALRVRSPTISSFPNIPEAISTYSINELDTEAQQPNHSLKADGWARFKNKFREGKLKPMAPPVSELPKPEPNDSNAPATRTTKIESNTPCKQSGNGNKRFRKGIKLLDTVGENSLHNAIVEGDVTAVRRIIESGRIDINFFKPPGVTPLHVACAFGNIKIIEQLVSNGADVRIKTWSSLSPLVISNLFGHFEVCQFLISSGASSLTFRMVSCTI